MMNKKNSKPLIAILLLLQAFSALKAQQTILGNVVDKDTGAPIAGATVSIGLAGNKSISDESGDFSIETAGQADTLYISNLGYVTYRLALTPRYSAQLLRVALTPVERVLEEVNVNTGYQVLTKERATGSFEIIDNKLFNRQISTDVISRLDGVVNSVHFDKRLGSGTDFSIRGLSTLTTAIRQPLIVLDNFPFEGDINSLNPNDIENVTFLKDAAASSIWGVRAGNGVVVITTKKGRRNQPLTIGFNANVNVIGKPDLYYQPAISSADFIDVEWFLFDQGFYNTALQNTTNRPVISPVVELLTSRQGADAGTVQAIDRAIGQYRKWDVRDDFLKHVYRSAINRQYALNFSGGTEKLNYIASVGYDDNLSNLIGDGYRRMTIRTDQAYRPVKDLEFAFGFQYAAGARDNNSQGGYGELATGGGKNFLYPYARLADDQGNPLALERGHRKLFLDTLGQGRLLNWESKPLGERDFANNSSTSRDILIRAGGKYRLMEGLDVSAQYQYQQGSRSALNIYGLETYFARDLINRYSTLTESGLIYNLPYGAIRDETGATTRAYGIRTQINLAKAWNLHRVDAIAGAEARESTAELSSTRSYGFDEQNYTVAPVDYLTRYPIIGNLSGNNVIPFADRFTGTISRNVSMYANASYNYKNRYTISASARRDASNVFGVATNSKWVPLWSVGTAWLISEETFYRAGWLPYLKLRATYGYSGNVNNSIPAVTTISYRSPTLSNSINGLPYAVISNFPNPNLRWEKVGMTNVGLDFSTKGARLSGSVEYYFKKSIDLISPVPLDRTAGAGATISANSAILNNHGVDITLNTLNLNGTLKWSSALLFSYNRNEVAKYLFDPGQLTTYVGADAIIFPKEGMPAYNLVSYRWNGLDPQTGDPIGSLDAKPSKDYNAIVYNATENDLVFHGSALPQYFGSFRNDLSFRKFSLSVNVVYRFDYYFRRSSINYSGLFNDWLGHADFSHRWQAPGHERHTNVPSMVYPANPQRDEVYVNSSALVARGDHIRLKDIRVSYEISLAELKKLNMKNVNVFFYANDIGIMWRANKHKLDPDYGYGMPAARSIAFGISTTF
ncbi:SusC/RagA family TonB-linked outer membrane protein [Parapedobacter pyrenivorans]|uniref:SusC/RagA family TonB-linked outer membrane protein n=1 Tax=Parapedobacter pyrenivorans TaxID=1305674 RepID=A0A917HYX6_9SPHI|nr:SusC/RagA family TonB-linked outer membrane protein [Parapedobacter pyrenivorans]GGG96519.1 SusC/RagA family TonB-linked outer membrane protein [Parapedobacter pyrenivorans]